ncbi:MAG: chemotaxis protein CheR, partial [candidate division Zixibacteria bacterium]|nr:chemotaxis protein CheR [Gammaproteobacteria bacterium]NIR48473.1 chemotaxis protein CheR [candidate division KSB1 bacterium]NIR63831.1 chemotaxis protein CheR [candidate division Zixibacteria bacterium]NIS45793.1 chemotaxis protein CheR [candidate division Zixibacteria bacterium]NIT70948.1 chemotaxis protein CheR [candidate division KSB1 bacterium]
MGIESFKDYINRVKGGDESEFINFVNAITTNLTSFFRENHHFTFLKNKVMPELLKRNQNERKLR